MSFIMEVKERDRILSSLDEVQKNFIQQHLKRGKRTAFANHMARSKGLILPENSPSEELELLLDEWILEDFIDNGYVNPETPCECGKPLRYQYIVKHKGTGIVKRFGITHFEEHTGIPPNLVQEIINGFNFIDYEMDELLYKLDSNWQLTNEIPFIPEDYVFPTDIQEHITYNVPLLNRQIKRLKHYILAALEEKQLNRNEINLFPTDDFPFEFNAIQGKDNQVSIQDTLFDNDHLSPREIGQKDFPISLYENEIKIFLLKGISSARVICELLIKEKGAARERYITGKPKIYTAVCLHLDSLVKNGDIELLHTKYTEDRFYRIISK
jgi:Protein of unknown function (DUF3895)